MTHPSTPSSGLPAQPRYGHRHEIVHNIQGSPFNQDTPLAAEDFLNPQPGDVFYHGERHDTIVERVRRGLEQVLRPRTNLTVLSNVILRLPAPARFHPLADLVIVQNLSTPNRTRATFDVAQEAGTIRAVIDVTSPLFAHLDLETKSALFTAPEIALLIESYIVLDTGLRTDSDTPQPRIFAWHNAPQDDSAQQSAQGTDRYCLPQLGLTLLAENTDFAVLDPTTNAPVETTLADTARLSETQAEGNFRAQSIASQLKL